MTKTTQNKNDIKNIATPLLTWYGENKRDLPWRRTKNPYAVLVSEMMLQQTQVNTVIDYYKRFLARFPSFEALAVAEEQDVLALWQGLGYYSRARNLHALAKRVVAEYGGVLPDEAEALRALPGIGDYMCGAVMSIAFEKPLPAVDGNVLRVSTRVLNRHEDITKAKTRKEISAQVAEWMPKNAAGDFTQAMMELGALICKPKNPSCDTCPLASHCAALAKGTVSVLPVKTPKQKPKTMEYFVVLVTAQDKLLMQRREEKGLLAGMWGLPMVEKRADTDIDAVVCGWINKPRRCGKRLGEAVHIFTHRRWEMSVIHYPIEKPMEDVSGTWVAMNELDRFPVPEAFKKAINMLPSQKRKKNEEK